jgi:peroxiredoxin
MKQRPIALIVVAVGSVFTLMAPVVSGQQAPKTSPVRVAGAPSSGTTAPDFELPALDGKLVRLSNLRGKIVLLEFTATWCPACYQAASDMRKLIRSFGANLSVLSISLDGGENTDTTREDLLRFVRQEKVAWPMLFDDTGNDNSAALAYKVERLPGYVLIDQSGIVRLTTHGAGVSRAIEIKIRSLLAELPKD